MRRGLLAALTAVVLAVAALAASVAGTRGLAAVAAGVTTVGVLIGLATTYRAPPAPGLPTPAPPQVPRPDLNTIGQNASTIRFAVQGPRWADTGLRPTLTRLADTLLDARTGYPLAARPDTAHRLLGDPLYTFLDPQRPVRGFDDGPPPTIAEIEQWISRLEDLT